MPINQPHRIDGPDTLGRAVILRLFALADYLGSRPSPRNPVETGHPTPARRSAVILRYSPSYRLRRQQQTP